jgi:hypothetical protein
MTSPNVTTRIQAPRGNIFRKLRRGRIVASLSAVSLGFEQKLHFHHLADDDAKS